MSDERHQERMHRPSSRMARRKGRVRKSPPAPAEPEAQALPAEEEAAAPRRFARTRLIIVAGYSAIGDGAWLDVFRPSTWQHILDFVEKGT